MVVTIALNRVLVSNHHGHPEPFTQPRAMMLLTLHGAGRPEPRHHHLAVVAVLALLDDNLGDGEVLRLPDPPLESVQQYHFGS